MMRTKRFPHILAVSGLALALAACGDEPGDNDTFEDAGAEIDEVGEDIEEGAAEAGEDIERGAEEVGQDLEQGAEEVGQETAELGEDIEQGTEEALAETGEEMSELGNEMEAEFAELDAEMAEMEPEEFMMAISERDGVMEEDGLYYTIKTEGSGPSPDENDIVVVHYTGVLPDGTVFDSSRQRGEPASFPLDKVIPGWTEGLQLMKEGGRATLYIPPEMAYGETGAGDVIPPNSPLVFDVELMEVQEVD